MLRASNERESQRTSAGNLLLDDRILGGVEISGARCNPKPQLCLYVDCDSMPSRRYGTFTTAKRSRNTMLKMSRWVFGKSRDPTALWGRGKET